MSREALMKFREDVLADEGLQQEIREVMATRDPAKAQAWVEEKGYTEEIVDFLENPGADVELSDLELEIVAGGATLRADMNPGCCMMALGHGGDDYGGE